MRCQEGAQYSRRATRCQRFGIQVRSVRLTVVADDFTQALDHAREAPGAQLQRYTRCPAWSESRWRDPWPSRRRSAPPPLRSCGSPRERAGGQSRPLAGSAAPAGARCFHRQLDRRSRAGPCGSALLARTGAMNLAARRSAAGACRGKRATISRASSNFTSRGLRPSATASRSAAISRQRAERQQLEIAPHQLVGDRHQLAEHLVGAAR